jgi:hypothetical protein
MLLFQTEPITWAPTQYHLSVAILSSYYKGCFIAPPVPSSFVRLWLQENVDIRLVLEKEVHLHISCFEISTEDGHDALILLVPKIGPHLIRFWARIRESECHGKLMNVIYQISRLDSSHRVVLRS